MTIAKLRIEMTKLRELSAARKRAAIYADRATWSIRLKQLDAEWCAKIEGKGFGEILAMLPSRPDYPLKEQFRELAASEDFDDQRQLFELVLRGA